MHVQVTDSLDLLQYLPVVAQECQAWEDTGCGALIRLPLLSFSSPQDPLRPGSPGMIMHEDVLKT